MFEMLDVAKRSTLVLSLKGYEEALRMAPAGKMVVAGVQVNVKDELKKIKAMVEMFTNQFVYVSDEVFDREKLYKAHADKQPPFLKLLAELLPLVNKATVGMDRHIDFEATNRMREIVNALNAGGV